MRADSILARGNHRQAATLILVLGIWLTTGCGTAVRERVTLEQDAYRSALSISVKEQLLANIVRLRYSDSPIFITTEQVVQSLTREVRVPVEAVGIIAGTDPDIASLSGQAIWSDNPTALHKPVTGTQYVESFLSTLSPVALFAMVDAGFPLDRLFSLLVTNANGHRNEHTEGGTAFPADPAFIRFIEVMKRLQIARAIEISLTPDGGADHRIAVDILESRLDEQLAQDYAAILDDMGLDPAASRYRVGRFVGVRAPDLITVSTRNMLQVLTALTPYVQVPGEDRDSVLVMMTGQDYPAPIRIHSGPEAPGNAYAAIRYRDQWFWIDPGDNRSKLTMVYLHMVFQLTRAGRQAGSQVIVPVRPSAEDGERNGDAPGEARSN